MGELAARRGVRGEVRPRTSFAYGAGEVFADQARVSDLAVVSLDLALGMPGRLLLSTVAFSSGRPVLMVPEASGMPRMPKRVLVAWDASPAAARAVAGALPFIRQADETVVATVTEDTALRAGQSGIELTHLLARHGASASFAAVRGDGRGALASLTECAWDQRGTTRLYIPSEVQFWSSRTVDLSGIHEQLEREGVKRIVAVLELAKSSCVARR